MATKITITTEFLLPESGPFAAMSSDAELSQNIGDLFRGMSHSIRESMLDALSDESLTLSDAQRRRLMEDLKSQLAFAELVTNNLKIKLDP